jgi:cardiolipin synthase
MAAEFLPGNRITLLDSGAEYFPALIAEIEAACSEIYLESYIFADDEVGHAVADALCRAAGRGVRVHVTVDGFGARNFAADFLPRLGDAGVRANVYRPETGLFRLRRHRLRRLHRKLVVIDGRVAFVGGINIIDDNNAPADMRPRYDYAARFEGPALRQAQQAARRMWEVVAWANLRQRFRSAPPAASWAGEANGQLAAFLVRDNIIHRHDILNAYLLAINAARHEILIANAYFLPGVRFGRALHAAARRGVRITILLQGKTDHPLLRYATQALYAQSLASGMRIFEYESSFMHAKVAVVDSEWATVGSSNIDPFSLLIAKEANLVVRDTTFARQLRNNIHEHVAVGAREMLPDELAQQSFPSKLLRWLAYGIVRLLVGITGYGPRHWQADEEKPGLTADAAAE